MRAMIRICALHLGHSKSSACMSHAQSAREYICVAANLLVVSVVAQSNSSGIMVYSRVPAITRASI
jgi:hypothetical protein